MSPGPNYPLAADEAAHTGNELVQGLWSRLSLPFNLGACGLSLLSPHMPGLLHSPTTCWVSVSQARLLSYGFFPFSPKFSMTQTSITKRGDHERLSNTKWLLNMYDKELSTN